MTESDDVMQAEQRDWIKKCVFEHLAPANGGKIMMADILRLFSEYGSYQELKQILDEFVKDGQARPIQKTGDTGYIFPGIARPIGEGLTKELREQERNLQETRTRIQTRNRQIETLEDLSSRWISGWERLLTDPARHAIIINYISSFWREPQQTLLAGIMEETRRLTYAENQIAALKRRTEESYNDC